MNLRERGFESPHPPPKKKKKNAPERFTPFPRAPERGEKSSVLYMLLMISTLNFLMKNSFEMPKRVIPPLPPF